MKSKHGCTLPLARKDVQRTFQKGYKALAALVTEALESEASADLADYDNLIGFGRLCGELCPGLDAEALEWAEYEPSESRLDAMCGFLTGYWMEKAAHDVLRPELLNQLLALRARIPLEPDSATGSVDVVEAGLWSKAVSPAQRKRLALRLLHIIDKEPEYRHDPLVRLRLERAAG